MNDWVLVPKYDEKAFSRDVIERWGKLSEELLDYQELLHVQMSALGRLCVSHPEAADDILTFLDGLLVRPDAISEIENAVAISFLDWQELESLATTRGIPAHVAKVAREQWKRGGQ